jgi:topoisomerase IA-like protein
MVFYKQGLLGDLYDLESLKEGDSKTIQIGNNKVTFYKEIGNKNYKITNGGSLFPSTVEGYNHADIMEARSRIAGGKRRKTQKRRKTKKIKRKIKKRKTYRRRR